MSSITRLFAGIRDLCLFRSGPQDMPYSPRVLIMLLIIGAIAEAAFDLPRGIPVAMVIGADAGTLIALAALHAMLRWRQKPERFVQSALALVVTSLLFELIVLPLILLGGLPTVLPTQHLALSVPQTLTLLAVFVLVVWQAGIAANILRQALQVPFAGGVLALLLIGFADLFASAIVAVMLGVT